MKKSLLRCAGVEHSRTHSLPRISAICFNLFNWQVGLDENKPFESKMMMVIMGKVAGASVVEAWASRDEQRRMISNFINVNI